MDKNYPNVITRFLHKEERQIFSEENELPLVIEAKTAKDSQFLREFLTANSAQILEDLASYGAVLLRGFEVDSDEDFEKTILSIQGFQGISEAFMSEEGRDHAGNLAYVLQTNSVYKTGGTVYLGAFHTENYYSPDVPAYISFFCIQPSTIGGETGLLNMEKIYQNLDENIKDKLKKSSYFVGKWLVSEVAERYQISTGQVEKLCKKFDLPFINAGDDKFILMYKPSVFENPQTKKQALQINFLELPNLNYELRKIFIKDYPGREWFWHRFYWRLPRPVLKIVETIYIMNASFFSSPIRAIKILISKWKNHRISKQISFEKTRVSTCFKPHDIKNLAQLIRASYSSCLWKKGDILLIDNRKIAHAGMTGAGPRLIRAMICNPIEMSYTATQPGCYVAKNRQTDSIGSYMNKEAAPSPSECFDLKAKS